MRSIALRIVRPRPTSRSTASHGARVASYVWSRALAACALRGAWWGWRSEVLNSFSGAS